MGLADLFRPKWKHSNVGVRSAAVKQLAAEELEALRFVALQDDDPMVRRIAIKKLVDPEILGEVAGNDADEAVRELANEKLSGLLVTSATGDDLDEALAALPRIRDQKALADVIKGAQHEEIWQQALARIEDPRALAEVARSGSHKDIRLAALARIDDPQVLRGIAIDDDRREMAQAALDRLEEADLLDEVVKKAKSKAVRAKAKKRAAALRAPSAEEQEARAESKKRSAKRAQLCRSVEALLKQRNLDKAIEQLEGLKDDWTKIEGQPETEDLKRWERAVERFDARRKAIEAEEARRELEEAERKQRLREEEERVEAERVEAEAESAEAEAERAAEAEERERRRQADLELLGKLVDEAEAAVAESDLRKAKQGFGAVRRDLRRLRRTLEREEELANRLNACEKRLEEREAEIERKKEEKAKQNAERLETICARLEKLCGSDNHRDIDSAMTEAGKAFRQMGTLPTRQQRDELKKRYEEVRKKLFIHRQELRESEEWKRWSNVGRKEELCRAVEALKEEKDLKKVAKTLRELQGKWKKQGPVSRDRADDLWVRFKTACDLAYARCETYFAELDEKRVETLRDKEELCEQVEALSDSEEWEETANRIKQLQADWKKLGPVPKEHSEAIWKRFRAGCDAFFDRRKEHYDELNEERKENLQQKTELCEEVEALVESTDWQATTDKIKGLQAMWKKIGPVPRKKSDAIWKRFRSACDAFFEHREEAREGERMGALREREAVCVELEELLAAPKAKPEGALEPESPEEEAEANEAKPSESAEDSRIESESPEEKDELTPAQRAKKVISAQQRWKRMGRVPRKHEQAIHVRFRAAVDAVVGAFPEAFADTELDPELSKRRREKICDRLAALLEECPDSAKANDAGDAEGSADAVDPEQAAEQLRAALAANALGGSGLWSWQEVNSELEQIKESWQRIGPVPGAEGEALMARYDEALKSLEARCPEEAKPADDRGRGRGRDNRRGGGRRDGERRDDRRRRDDGDEGERRGKRGRRGRRDRREDGESAEPKAEEPKAEEPKAEEPKAEEPKAEEPKAEEPKAEEPKADEPKAEEPKAEEPKAEEPKAEEPKADDVDKA